MARSTKYGGDSGNEERTHLDDYAHEIYALVKNNLTPVILAEKLSDYHENDIAAALELMAKDERLRTYSVLDTDTLADVMEYADDINTYLNELTIKKRVEVLSKIEIKITSEYLRDLDHDQRKNLLDLMPANERREILASYAFDDDEIGFYMTTNCIKIPAGCDVPQAMKHLVEQAADNDNISTLYVIQEDGTLAGAIDLNDLIVARRNTDLNTIIMTSYPYVYAHEMIDNCLERIKDYSEDSIPVLDDYNVLQGILTAQDVTDIVNEELGEDYAKFAGLSSEEDIKEPVRLSIRKRLPWLIILMFLGLFVSTVVGKFEHVVKQITLIVSFQSLVLDMAGNVGTQSLAVAIRVLMDDRVTSKEKMQLLSKESRIGLINGFFLGSISFVFVGLYLMIIRGESPSLSFSVSLCTGIALLVAMMFSAVVGTATPMLFKKVNIDPAVASGPLITTMNDLIAVTAYYGTAWILLLNVLGLGH
jgi:magnesium transporter